MGEIADQIKEDTAPLGIPHARKLIVQAMTRIEQQAAPSGLKTEVLELLRQAEFHTWRNTTKAPSRRVSRPMTGELVKDILLAIAARPTASNKEIAEAFGVQAGRITEVRQGKHSHKLGPALRSVLGDMKADANEQLAFPKVRRAA